MKLSCLFFLFLPSFVFSQVPTGQLFIVQDSWGKSGVTHTCYGFISQTLVQPDTADLFLFSRLVQVDKKLLLLQPVPLSLIQFTKVFSPDVHIDSCFIKLRSGRNLQFRVTQYIRTQTSQIHFSPLLTFQQKRTPGQPVYKIPANYFNPDSDSLFITSSSEFFPGGKGNRLGYQLNVLSSNQDTVLRFYQKIPDSTLRINSISLSLKKIPSGKYDLRLNYLINNTVVAQTSAGPIFILTTDANKENSGSVQSKTETKSIFSSYTEEELDMLADKAKYIATIEENQLYSNLSSISQKQKFMTTFWEKREGDVQNNLYNYLEKISYIQSAYGISGKQGYKTDRGKIFLKYGHCDDVFVSTSKMGVKPFEVWYYPSINGQNSVYFYFVDQNGFGDFQLVHSTALNEVYNPELLKRLGIDPTSYRE